MPAWNERYALHKFEACPMCLEDIHKFFPLHKYLGLVSSSSTWLFSQFDMLQEQYLLHAPGTIKDCTIITPKVTVKMNEWVSYEQTAISPAIFLHNQLC